MSTSKNILIIGSYKSEGVDCFDWFEELPNLEDYDTVILDTVRIFNIWYSSGKVKPSGNVFELSHVDDMDRKIISNIALIRRKLIEILYFDVSIYALYSPRIQVNYGDTTQYAIFTSNRNIMGTDDWCPIYVSTITEKGKTILVEDSSYKDYFTDFKNWEYYIDTDDVGIGELLHYYEDKWYVSSILEIIASSRAVKPIAISFSPGFHDWKDSKHKAYLAECSNIGGSLVLLPVDNPNNTSPHIEFLLKRVMEFEETPPPSWVNDIEIPGEASYKTKLSKGAEKLKKAEADLESFKDSLNQIQKYKRVLYDTGHSLQDISKQTLEELGVKTKPSISTDEFIIEVGDKEALAEVKGNTKSVKKEDIAQLIVDLGQHFKDTGKEIKGILIGNAWRLLPLDERDIRGKPVFTKETIQAAQNHNIGLVSTVELFKAYCKVLEQPECRSEIPDKIINGKGIIRL